MLVDNLAEFKRSSELPMYLAKTYETNYLINVAEYVLVIEKDAFIHNEDGIKAILADISKDYLFDDVGYNLKNYCNWGARFDTNGEDDLLILDYGYLYPLFGQNREELFRCPKCGSRLHWNPSYTEFVCMGSNGSERCSARFSPMAIRRNMKLDFEDIEEKMMAEFNQLQKPNLNTIEKSIVT